MAEAWPWAEIGDHTTEVWAQALRGADYGMAKAAMLRCVETDERPPTVARLRAVIGDLSARQRADTAAIEAPKADRSLVAARFRAISDCWAAAREGRPEHDHRRGSEACPRCSTKDAFLDAVTPVIIEQLRGTTP